MRYDYLFKSFDELSTTELYAILKLRNDVFVVEQKCAFQEIDDKDQQCFHAIIYDGKNIAAYCRVAPAGIIVPDASIGRVITSPGYRGAGLGKSIMEYVINQCKQLFGNSAITISAQVYVLDFYLNLGFHKTGEIYEEDGIPHLDMVLHPAI